MSKKITLAGDIIITDPCYVIARNSRPKFADYFSDPDMGSKQFSAYTAEESALYQQYKADCEKYDATHPDQWDLCECGSRMDKLGFTNYISASTLYGDWSCTTFELKTNPDGSVPLVTEVCDESIKGILGEFCADSGQVGVFLLEEVLTNNPEFDYHINRKWTTTLIPKFNGVVEYVVHGGEVFIVGTGNINFITRQTGF